MKNAWGIPAFVLFMVMVSSVAFADDNSPWKIGVSTESQDQALKVHNTANDAFANRRYTEAIAGYRKALLIWDHPAIHYNLAITLIETGDLLNAVEHLEKGLAYEGAALESTFYKQGKTYQKLLEGQLATIVIEVGEPGGTILLDGKEVLRSQGRVTQRVMAQEHAIVATKPGAITFTRTVKLGPGEQLKVDIVFQKPEEFVLRRRWARWKPWAAFAGGAVLSATGVATWLAADSARDDYQQAILDGCALLHPGTVGCLPTDNPSNQPAVASARKDWRTKRAVTWVALSLGAVTTVGALGALFLNRPLAEKRAVRIAPSIGPDGPGIMVFAEF